MEDWKLFYSLWRSSNKFAPVTGWGGGDMARLGDLIFSMPQAVSVQLC